MNPTTPKQWSAYPCGDYLAGHWWQSGHFDELSQTLVIVPLSDAYENTDIEFLAVGRSGADGIDFGFRKGQAGLWAFYPYEGEFKFMATNVQELVEGWCSGKLHV
jgi:hypothetical protein